MRSNAAGTNVGAGRLELPSDRWIGSRLGFRIVYVRYVWQRSERAMWDLFHFNRLLPHIPSPRRHHDGAFRCQEYRQSRVF